MCIIVNPGLLFSFSLFVVSSVRAAITWSASPFDPPAVPLAVRTPYLSTWLPVGNGTALNGAWPVFWNGQVTGWSGFIRVDGIGYSFMGTASDLSATFQQAKQTSFQFTSTSSVFILSAGPVDLTVTFLSPVEPNDLVRQSMPFSYMSLSAAAADGGSHSVQIYTDISAEWTSGDSSLNCTWSTELGDTSIITHQVQLQNSSTFLELNEHTQYGSAFYSTLTLPGITYQTGQDVVVRSQFLRNGTLFNTLDTNFRVISHDWPVFAFARDLGTVSAAGTANATVFAIAHSRDPAVEYITANGATQNRSLYYLSQFSSPLDAIASFLADYPAALDRANALDVQISNDATKISDDYASIVALSVRQALGALELTVSKNNDGSWNTSDVLGFIKEISSSTSINTVDSIFPAWPAFLYIDPALGKYLLTPLLEYQATGQYPNQYSVHDLGPNYPKATGHNDGQDLAMPIEECGNMLIMVLSYTQKTGDQSLITRYSKLLDQWAQFLIKNSLAPPLQPSTDNFAGPLANQTNLAIKGIIGIRAMSEIAQLLGDIDTSAKYNSISASYASQWQALATSSTSNGNGGHLTLSYGNNPSWGLAYNLMADKLLQTNIFPSSVYDMQTEWYNSVMNAYGVPLDTRNTYTLSGWSIWTASIVNDTTTRDMFISSVAKWASSGLSNLPLGDWYDADNGAPEKFKARPVVGGHLALLVLNDPSSTVSGGTPSQSSSTTTTTTTSTSKAKSSAQRPFNVFSILHLIFTI